MDGELHNRKQIEHLNQRGGRPLSAVDLINAGTLTAPMAALCGALIDAGAGMLTGAVPGGAGKTTLMAALMAFLPPGEGIVTITDDGVQEALDRAGTLRPATLLAHEIGSGPVFGYIWGQEAVDFLRARRRDGMRCISCLHADTPDQTRDALTGLGAAPDDLAAVPLQLYMRVSDGQGARRHRVASVDWADGRDIVTLYRWDPDADTHEECRPRAETAADLAARLGVDADALASAWEALERLLTELVREGVNDFADVRERAVGPFERQGGLS